MQTYQTCFQFSHSKKTTITYSNGFSVAFYFYSNALCFVTVLKHATYRSEKHIANNSM